MSDLRLFVIGDEILSGKRQDRHLPAVIELLRSRNLELAGAEFLPDDEVRIAAAIVRVRGEGSVLLCCGGIGATPDDLTRQAAARAFGVPIQRHPQAQALIEAQYGERAHPHRVLMADLPRGARLIPNPVNRVPGFALERCFFVPGFPEMAQPMLAWVLEHELADLRPAQTLLERRLQVIGEQVGEGDLLPAMRQLLAEFPGLRLASLPCRGDASRPRHIELGLKGPPGQVEVAFERLQTLLRALDVQTRLLA